MVCNVFLNTLFLSMMSGKGILALIPMRLVKNMIMWPIDTALFYLIAKKMEMPECEGNPEIQTAGCKSVNRRTPM